MVTGVTCLSVQIPIQSTYVPHIFESANYSILISDFLNFGQIPIVQHYGGHMMMSVWEGILYGLINNDYVGAAMSPYAALDKVVLAVLFYYLIKNIWNENIAILVVLTFPFYGFWSVYGLGMLVCLSTMAYVKRNSYLRAIILWLTVIWCAIYRLDLGFAFGFAAVISLSIYILVLKNWKAVKELGIALIGWVGIGGCAWWSICLIKGINPAKRLIEFLLISLSNRNWAFESIGDNSITMFAWAYLIIPFAMIVCILYTVFSKRFRERMGKEKWVLLLILGSSYFGNFSRGLVRHSVLEMQTQYIFWDAYLFLAIFWTSFAENKKLFLPSFMLLILFNMVLCQPQNFAEKPIIDQALIRPEVITRSWVVGKEDWNGKSTKEPMTYWEQLKYNNEVVERVRLDDKLQKEIRTYELLMDTILEDDETFIDFTNHTLVYSAIGRKNPVYISQSPLQLSGEFTQKQFIEEMQGVPVILMPIEDTDASYALDGIANVYRNYKVSEYIYQNYVPLCKYGTTYALWCQQEKYSMYKKRLEPLVKELEVLDTLLYCEDLRVEELDMVSNVDGFVTLIPTGEAPMIAELQNIIDSSLYLNDKILIKIKYATDCKGIMELYYTTEKGEDYGNNAIKAELNEKGIIEFLVPITEYSRLKLNIFTDSKVKIYSLTVQQPYEYIAYGYDGPYEENDVLGNI